MSAEIETEPRFGFGANWARFLNGLTDEKIQNGVASVTRLLGPDLKGKTLIDIGSGSGLFSLAARKLGATVFSFDYDTDSVGCTDALRRRYFPNDPNWTVEQGSILDDQYLAKLPKYDIVYSWGVLHHTGSMWQAISNAAKLVKPGGTLMIGIYNFREGRRGTVAWAKRKRWYCEAPRWQRWVYETAYCTWQLTYMTLVGRNAVRMLREYRNERGMSWWRDVTDWIGGYPYEAATPGEILDFVRQHFNYELVKQNVNCGLGVSEFVFHAP
jgi:SAM-dependent methyltransferase